jgi:hypothetical protein
VSSKENEEKEKKSKLKKEVEQQLAKQKEGKTHHNSLKEIRNFA